MKYNATTKLLYWRWIGLYLNYNYKIDDAETALTKKTTKSGNSFRKPASLTTLTNTTSCLRLTLTDG